MREATAATKQRILDKVEEAVAAHTAPNLSDREYRQWFDTSRRANERYGYHGVLLGAGMSKRQPIPADMTPEAQVDCRLAVRAQQLRWTFSVGAA